MTVVDRAERILRERLLSVVGLLILATVALLWSGRFPDVTVPRRLRLLVVSALFASPIGYVAGRKVCDWVDVETFVYLVELRAEEPEASGLYRIPMDHMTDLDVVEGGLDRVGPQIAFARRVDLEAMEAVGCWRGTLTDRQLMIALSKVKECRDQLQEDARKGFVLRTRAWSIVRAAVRDTTQRVVETFESATLPDSGESLQEAVDKAMRDANLEDLTEVDPSGEEVVEDDEDGPDDRLEGLDPVPQEVVGDD